ncbi:MAG: BrnT family toxin [Lachnospiraceae bacterium]|nr:BrnT family toxin [Lachnospiraceae bacterium]
MDDISFDWDEEKNKKNIKKHKVSFEEAVTVFYDENAIVFDDPDHSKDENRFLIIGESVTDKLLIVSHCYRDNDNVIRIISARLAVKKEKAYYNKQFL